MTEHELDIIKKSILPSKRLIKDAKPIILGEGLSHSINCYAYAMGIMYPGDYCDPNMYNPGFTVDCGLFWRNQTVKKVCIDLDVLGFRFKKFEINEEFDLERGEYLVKLFISDSDFHFIRYDPNSGIWFDKMGWKLEPRVIKPDYDEILKPSRFGSNEPHEIACGHYKPICYFKIKERR